MSGQLSRRLGAEVVGSLLLTLFGAGAVVAAFFQVGELTYAGFGFVGLSFAVGIAVAIYAFGPVSGAHINPTVTIVLAIIRRFPWKDVLPYVAAQLVGGVLAGLLILAFVGTQASDLGSVGLTELADGVSWWQGIVAEIVGTFILITAIMAMAIDTRGNVAWAGWIIGLAVAAAVFVVGPVSGASLNLQRTFGPYLANTLAGGDTPWAQLPLYLVGPVIGGLLAALAYEWIARPPRPEPVPDQEPEYDEAAGRTRMKGDRDQGPPSSTR